MGHLRYGFQTTLAGVDYDAAVTQVTDALAEEGFGILTHTDPHIGLILACNVVVQETAGGDVMVSVSDPRSMFGVVRSVGVADVAGEAAVRLRRVTDALGTAKPV